jgi:hypothetical protein
VTDPRSYSARCLFVVEIADDPLIRPGEFSLAGPRRAGIRHSVSPARRFGLRVVRWDDGLWPEIEAVSAEWLAGERGGELGFTLGRVTRESLAATDARIALDANRRVVAFCTWHRFGDGRGRVLDVMRRSRAAPNPAMDFLITESLVDFARSGVEVASLEWYPTPSDRWSSGPIRRDRCDGTRTSSPPNGSRAIWSAPPRWSYPAALLALARAYFHDGVTRAFRRNG